MESTSFRSLLVVELLLIVSVRVLLEGGREREDNFHFVIIQHAQLTHSVLLLLFQWRSDHQWRVELRGRERGREERGESREVSKVTDSNYKCVRIRISRFNGIIVIPETSQTLYCNIK